MSRKKSKKKSSYNLITTEQYFTKLNEELEKIDEIGDMRLLALVLHLYAEYWLDQIIKKVFFDYELILRDIPENALRFFSNKLYIVRGLGIIGENEFNNLLKLNKIRNLYGHNLDPQIISPDVKKNIKEMIDLSPIEDYTTEDCFEALKLKTISTIRVLYQGQLDLESYDKLYFMNIMNPPANFKWNSE